MLANERQEKAKNEWWDQANTFPMWMSEHKIPHSVPSAYVCVCILCERAAIEIGIEIGILWIGKLANYIPKVHRLVEL